MFKCLALMSLVVQFRNPPLPLAAPISPACVVLRVSQLRFFYFSFLFQSKSFLTSWLCSIITACCAESDEGSDHPRDNLNQTTPEILMKSTARLWRELWAGSGLGRQYFRELASWNSAHRKSQLDDSQRRCGTVASFKTSCGVSESSNSKFWELDLKTIYGRICSFCLFAKTKLAIGGPKRLAQYHFLLLWTCHPTSHPRRFVIARHSNVGKSFLIASSVLNVRSRNLAGFCLLNEFIRENGRSGRWASSHNLLVMADWPDWLWNITR